MSLDKKESVKGIFNTLSKEEKKELIKLLLAEAQIKEKEPEQVPLVQQEQFAKKTPEIASIIDEQKHKMAIQSIDRLLSKIEKRISELDELKKEKSSLLAIAQ